jgi:phage baseplate assembly protein W
VTALTVAARRMDARVYAYGWKPELPTILDRAIERASQVQITPEVIVALKRHVAPLPPTVDLTQVLRDVFAAAGLEVIE